MKYYLDFDPFDEDVYLLNRIEDHETIYRGRLSELEEKYPGWFWQGALDEFFEMELGIKPDEWEIG